MKTQRVNIKIIAIFSIAFYGICGWSQPYTLDESLNPIELLVGEHPYYDTAGYLDYDGEVAAKDTIYHYITGQDMYQFLDVYVFSDFGNPRISVSVTGTTWSDIRDQGETKTSENEIIHFKLRSYNDIGLILANEEESSSRYSIIVSASPPQQNILGSPFTPASEEDMAFEKAVEVANSPNTKVPSNSNFWIYISLGLGLLVIGLLLGKWIAKNKASKALLLILFLSLTNHLKSQSIVLPEAQATNESTRTERRQAELERESTRRRVIDNGFSRMNQWYASGEAAQGMVEQYMNMENCLNSGPPPGQPRIPSFCEEAGENCASCFREARRKFNDARYSLEKLQTIYDCTKNATDAAVAFGDNVSGYHGVVGIVWQTERKKVMNSLDGLNGAYDRKRVELLRELDNSLRELAACEEEHGMQDWYDRFGVLFYNFMEMRYHR